MVAGLEEISFSLGSGKEMPERIGPEAWKGWGELGGILDKCLDRCD